MDLSLKPVKKKRGVCMSESKVNIIEKINLMPDDMNEIQLVERLYMLICLEHSQKRCEDEGTYTGEQVTEHFTRKRE